MVEFVVDIRKVLSSNMFVSSLKSICRSGSFLTYGSSFAPIFASRDLLECYFFGETASCLLFWRPFTFGLVSLEL